MLNSEERAQVHQAKNQGILNVFHQMYSVLGQGYVTSPYNDIQAKHTQMNNVLLLHPRFSIGLTQDLRNLLHPPNN